jgi:uncharacterized protein
MTPDERNLIMGLFDRMRSFGTIEKEREAEALINAEVRKIPDSAYMLVQSALVNEQLVASSQERIQQLEARVRDLESRAPAPQQSSGGSFLGGLFGGGSRAQPTSVPATRGAAPGGPWGQPAPQYQQGAPQYQQGGMPMQQAAPQRAGGGFMAQAMTTAAGVAGGMLAANAISNMMNGHKSHDSGTQNTGFDQAAADRNQDAQQDQEFAQQETYATDNDPGTSGASDSGGGWGGGGDSDA